MVGIYRSYAIHIMAAKSPTPQPIAAMQQINVHDTVASTLPTMLPSSGIHGNINKHTKTAG